MKKAIPKNEQKKSATTHQKIPQEITMFAGSQQMIKEHKYEFQVT